MSVWFAYTTSEAFPAIERAVLTSDPGASVRRVTEPTTLRELVRLAPAGGVNAIVGPDDDVISAINLAAAIVADGCAARVVLVCNEVSGSVRSRAARAGIDRVMDEIDLVEAACAQPDADVEGVSMAYVGTGHPGPVNVPVVPTGSTGVHEPVAQAAVASGAVERKEGSGAIVAFAHGRGGTGTSTLVSVAASIAAGWGMRVAVLDMDLCAGNLASMLGVGNPPDLAALVSKPPLTPESVMSCAATVSNGVRLFGPCARPEFAETISPLVEPLLMTLANEHDLVLVDTPTTCTDGVAQVFQACDRLLVVSDERPGAAASATRLTGLAQRLGVARAQVMRVSNRCDLRERESPIVLGQGADAARAFRVADGYEDVEDMIAAGEAAALAELRCDFVDTCSSMLAKTLVELGRLPQGEEAHAAAEYTEPRTRLGLFARIREAS